jgi:PAS domain-containing protein
VDVTARKEAERVLLNARDELERLVQARTRELAESNRQLEAEIEERTQAEEAVREREERLRRVLENMPVMLVAYDEQASAFVVWNRECERVTGWSARDRRQDGHGNHPLLYPDKDYLRQSGSWKRAGTLPELDGIGCARTGAQDISGRTYPGFPDPRLGDWGVGSRSPSAARPASAPWS